MNLKQINELFEYKSDGKNDDWNVMKISPKNQLLGDCEDYGMTVYFHTIADQSWFKFWKGVLLREVRFWYVTNKGGGHFVLEHDGLVIDNWSKDWMTIKEMKEKFGHEFKYRFSFLGVLRRFIF